MRAAGGGAASFELASDGPQFRARAGLPQASFQPVEVLEQVDDEASLARGKLEGFDELAPQTRRAVDLRYEEARTPTQIATLCGWTAETAYSILSRARTFLRECIERRMQHAP